MSGSHRFLVQPRWIALHLVAIALVVTMVLLGRWQLIVSDEKGFSLQNFGYAVQWWAFSAFTVWVWFRLVRDHVRGAPEPQAPQPTPEPVAYRRYVMPTVTPVSAVEDPELAAYNDYLARLAQKEAHDDQHR